MLVNSEIKYCLNYCKLEQPNMIQEGMIEDLICDTG